ncbi:helix-turn-helix domain-containing protein [Oceanidesulfovibrio marinus]|uniref:Helix-turn-helix transcriptional regulator n=1 Tax=Oceanidesulfovibrio marinus TaxID=370038 RepID=A0ABX6NF80_9BACT|nr:helix-turn-helix domain-containing protein [Oceanidesulfovibrio marinus]QJT09269.1 helix-turn-helix transcriptional regulator [Oceanidesulfovibrio marinus]
MSSDIIKESVANRLRAHRTRSGMSLDAAAAATGVSKAMLGQIERRESAPTIATLWKIARGLGISFSSFFPEPSPAQPDRPLFPHDPDMRVVLVFPYNPVTRMEMLRVTLKNHHLQRSLAHQIGVVEHVVPISGIIDVWYEDSWRTATPDSPIRFHADVPHAYRAVTETAVFENIICYT